MISNNVHDHPQSRTGDLGDVLPTEPLQLYPNEERKKQLKVRTF